MLSTASSSSSATASNWVDVDPHRVSLQDRYRYHPVLYSLVPNHDATAPAIEQCMLTLQSDAAAGRKRLAPLASRRTLHIDADTAPPSHDGPVRLGLHRHMPSFLNDPQHNHRLIGYALPFPMIATLFLPPVAMVAPPDAVAFSSVAEECIVVGVDHPEADAWAMRLGGAFIAVRDDAIATRGDSKWVRAAIKKHADRRDVARGLMSDADIRAYGSSPVTRARWDAVSRAVSVAVHMLEMRKADCAGHFLPKLFLVPLRNDPFQQQACFFLALALSLLAPTYYSGNESSGDKGDAPCIGINDALAVTAGVFDRLLSVMDGGGCDSGMLRVNGEIVRAFQVHLRAIVYHRYSSWNMLAEASRSKALGNKPAEALMTHCVGELPPHFVQAESWHWPRRLSIDVAPAAPGAVAEAIATHKRGREEAKEEEEEDSHKRTRVLHSIPEESDDDVMADLAGDLAVGAPNDSESSAGEVAFRFTSPTPFDLQEAALLLPLDRSSPLPFAFGVENVPSAAEIQREMETLRLNLAAFRRIQKQNAELSAYLATVREASSPSLVAH